MSKIRFTIAVVAILATCAVSLRAEQSEAPGVAQRAGLDALRDSIRANRKALVAANLRLTDDEAAKFWSVYDRYQKENTTIGDRLENVIQDYIRSFREVSDDKALKLVDEYLRVEADRVALRRSYMPEFAKTLPGRKVARFYQIENKMDAVIRYDLAATIPVIDEETEAPVK